MQTNETKTEAEVVLTPFLAEVKRRAEARGFAVIADTFPSVEEMVRVLYARPWGECEAGKRRVLDLFLTEWSRYSGEPVGCAKRRAEKLVAEVEQ